MEVPARRMRKLSVLSGSASGTEFTLRDGCISVGRAEESVILLDELGVSRHHALLIAEGEEYRVRDLDSANGTLLNGRRVSEARLSDGDVLNFGAAELRYDVVEEPVVIAELRPPADSVLAGRSHRGMWLGVTVVASIVSAGVSFFLASRLPEQAVELAAPATAVASLPAMATSQHYRDPHGRFVCEVPAGWRIESATGDGRSKVNFGWGNDEIRVIAQPARAATVTETERAEVLRAVAQWGALRGTSWRTVGAARAWQLELETPAPEALWVRMVKFREAGMDHTVALYVAAGSPREKLAGQFEEFLRQYLVQ